MCWHLLCTLLVVIFSSSFVILLYWPAYRAKVDCCCPIKKKKNSSEPTSAILEISFWLRPETFPDILNSCSLTSSILRYAGRTTENMRVIQKAHENCSAFFQYFGNVWLSNLPLNLFVGVRIFVCSRDEKHRSLFKDSILLTIVLMILVLSCVEQFSSLQS